MNTKGEVTPLVHTLAEMIAVCRFDGVVHPDIIAEHFPVKPELFTAVGSKVFHFDRRMTTSEVEAAIRKEGYEPDPIEKLLAYSAKNPDKQRKYPIVALGSSWVFPRGSRRIPLLDKGNCRRYVGLRWDYPGFQWFGYYRFLASGKSST